MMILISIFATFFKLGCIAFGGPAAHIALFRKTFVDEKQWLTDNEFSQIMAVAQFMPGPASSQIGISLGLHKAGQIGGFVAWLGFTLPTAIVLIAIAQGMLLVDTNNIEPVINGLKLATAAIVLHAVSSMFKSFCRDTLTIAICLTTALLMVLLDSIWLQFILLLVAAACAAIFRKSKQNTQAQQSVSLPISRLAFRTSLLLFASLMIILPVASYYFSQPLLDLFARFFRVGATVFGGGHVVLPMLQQEMVTTGWVTENAFLAGYGITQAMPGPIFTFAAFLGAVNQLAIPSVIAAMIALIAIFSPSFLLINICFFYWRKLSENAAIRASLIGINAAVVGLLLAAFYQPIFISSVDSVLQLIAFILLTALVFWQKVPVWLIVILAGGCGYFWQFLQ
ncbi:chromate efflux transporter [Catenovulum sediminis]|uniref:chromate efflux transporter n=1 Tax=Catenovulum sediminis TaxID=1740262 RepID=UPI00117DA4C5|nr:chromate efflux transporter [Catenovulum sediminis]